MFSFFDTNFLKFGIVFLTSLISVSKVFNHDHYSSLYAILKMQDFKMGDYSLINVMKAKAAVGLRQSLLTGIPVV